MEPPETPHFQGKAVELGRWVWWLTGFSRLGSCPGGYCLGGFIDNSFQWHIHHQEVAASWCKSPMAASQQQYVKQGFIWLKL